ncbi:glycosyltransferase family 2 protein [Bacteroidota bacterium]
MENISVIIITGNEERNIVDCLQSVNWADEIIVVDSESTDSTVELSKKFTDKVFINKWEGFAKQKAYALSLASNKWVLSLDADERVSDQLREEIVNLQPGDNVGFIIQRRNHFLGKNITTCGWGKDYQLRLFIKSKTKLNDRLVHEGFIVDGKTTRLKGQLIHYTYTSIENTLTKINHYSSLQAQEYYGKKRTGGIGFILHPLGAFLRLFISLKGYKDGIHGMLIAFFNSLTTLQTYLKIWEMHNLKKNR